MGKDKRPAYVTGKPTAMRPAQSRAQAAEEGRSRPPTVGEVDEAMHALSVALEALTASLQAQAVATAAATASIRVLHRVEINRKAEEAHRG